MGEITRSPGMAVLEKKLERTLLYIVPPSLSSRTCRQKGTLSAPGPSKKSTWRAFWPSFKGRSSEWADFASSAHLTRISDKNDENEGAPASDSIHSFSSSPIVPPVPAVEPPLARAHIDEGNILVPDSSWEEEVTKWVPSPPDPPSQGNILVAETSFEILVAETSFGEGSLEAEVRAAHTQSLTSNRSHSQRGLDELRVCDTDTLDLTQDMNNVLKPQVSPFLRREADAIFEKEQAHLVKEANRKARRKEVLYINDYGQALILFGVTNAN